jgi:N-acyl amino acid synthase of PEP-CTERM/exosortase system
MQSHPHGSDGVLVNALPPFPSPYFTAVVVDQTPELLDATYRLRYQVYCLERRFLPAERYPSGREIDQYDPYSVHFAVVDRSGEIAATARLIPLTHAGLPLLDHCPLFPHVRSLTDLLGQVVEVSRLCVSRRYNRRRGDAYYALQGATYDPETRERRGTAQGGEIIMTLCQALYQASKRSGYTHWLAGTEKSLQRLISVYSLPFKPIGPEVDYYGTVTPYAMDVREFDRVVSSGTVPLVSHFLTGLEPEFRPVAARSVPGDIVKP